jgi:hypothetical protein
MQFLRYSFAVFADTVGVLRGMSLEIRFLPGVVLLRELAAASGLAFEEWLVLPAVPGTGYHLNKKDF